MPLTASLRNGCLLVATLGLVASRRLAAQVGATTDIITGIVTGPDSQPLAGIVVQATSLETQVSRSRTTDARGRFTIVFADGGGQYQLVARFVGMAPVRLTIARQADEDRLVANIRMGSLAVSLDPVTVTARRIARERPAPGSTERNLTPDQLARLPIDASDLCSKDATRPATSRAAGPAAGTPAWDEVVVAGSVDAGASGAAVAVAGGAGKG